MTEIELLNLAKSNQSAVEELLNMYKPLVSKIARRYYFACGDIDDLLQEGMIGLYSAIKSFDLDKDASFKTFASICITRKIQSAVRHANTDKNKVFFGIV